MSERDDDFDLEVSALHIAPDAIAPDAPEAHESAANAPDASSTPDDLEASGPDPLTRRISLAARRTRRQRLARTGSAVAVLLLLVSAVLLVPAGNRAALLQLAQLVTPPPPLPTAVPQEGDDLFLWEHSVPWGQLRIDGKPGPIVSGPATGAAFRLSRGRHTLEYTAALFPPLRCVVTVPFQRDDTCPLDRGLGASSITSSTPLTRVLDLRATIDRLPSAQAQELIAETQARFTAMATALPHGTLVPGDHYLDTSGDLRQITPSDDIHALSPQFRLASSLDLYAGTACITLCTRTGLGESYGEDANARGWALLAPVDLTWRYLAADGRVALDNGPSVPVGAQRSMLIPIVARWQADTWQVDIPVYGKQADPVLCVTGQHYREVLQLTPGQTSIDDQNFPWPFLVSTSELGCLYAGSARDPLSGKPIGPFALAFYRAGVLLAVNPMAHEVFPSLPMASAHESALANAVAPTQFE